MHIGRKTNLPLSYIHKIYKCVNDRILIEVLEDPTLIPSFQYLANFLQLPSTDLVPVFAYMTEKSLDEETVSMKQLVEFFGKEVAHYPDLEECVSVLIRLKLLNSRFERSMSFDDADHKVKIYSVRKNVLNSMIKGNRNLLEPDPIKTIVQFISEVSKLTRMRDRDLIDTEMLLNELDFLYHACIDIPAVAAIRNFDMGLEEELIFWNVSHRGINKNQEEIDIGDILNEIYESPVDAFSMKRKLIEKEMKLLKNDLIVISKEYFSFFVQVKLSEEATKLLLDKTELLRHNFKPKHCKLEEYQLLPQEALFYNEAEASQVDEITRIVEPSAFQDFLKKTKEHQLSGGLTILLHGYAGTGKTATAKKIAKATGRHLLWVEVDKIKACFVGESEQNLQAVFDEYEQACKAFDKHPILLFNEADAILSKRMNVSSSADQMNNSLQNILLQRMENFTGVFIATTNLASHLDKAFDRRFLYKIHFKKPADDVRMRIMQHAFPDKNLSTLEKLNRFALTGGQIMNIKKRLMVQHLLNKEASPLEQLCEEELSLQQKTAPIGFCSSKNQTP